MSRETPPTFGEMIEQSAPQIDGVRRALEVAQPVCMENEGQRKIIALSYAFLVAEGRLSEEEYFPLLKLCVDAQDFTEMGIAFHTHQLAQITKELRADSLPETGDDFHPGRQHLQNEMALVQSSARDIKKKKELSGSNPIANIGASSLRHRPEWFLMMEQEHLKLDQIFALVDKLPAESSGNHADVIDFVTRTRSKVRNDVA